MSKAKASTCLSRALALLGPEGTRWVKGDYEVGKGQEFESPITRTVKIFPNGAFCSLGAIFKIDGPAEERARKFLELAIKKSGFYGGIVCFNDTPRRKFSSVEQKFKEAIKLAKAKGD